VIQGGCRDHDLPDVKNQVFIRYDEMIMGERVKISIYLLNLKSEKFETTRKMPFSRQS